MRTTTWFPVIVGDTPQHINVIGPARVIGFFSMNGQPSVLIEHDSWMHQNSFGEVVDILVRHSGNTVPEEAGYQFGGVLAWEYYGSTSVLVMYWKTDTGV